MADSSQQALQATAQDYQKIQEELQAAVDARQRLESQQHENKSVQGEFLNAKEDEAIYKLVGPVLLKQDKDEALSTVNGRLEYIESELSRVEDQIKSIQKRSDDKRAEIVQLQSAAQQQSAGPQSS